MRIVAGSHRGRRIAAPPGHDVRPTADRVREAIFNILAHAPFASGAAFDGARVLDAFAGTGAMGLEALSRGAEHAIFMDRDVSACQANIEALGLRDRARSIRGDCLHPPPADTPCTLAFLDPPYRSGLAAPALEALLTAGWIAPATVCTLELSRGEDFTPPDAFATLDDRAYGAARVVFLGV